MLPRTPKPLNPEPETNSKTLNPRDTPNPNSLSPCFASASLALLFGGSRALSPRSADRAGPPPPPRSSGGPARDEAQPSEGFQGSARAHFEAILLYFALFLFWGSKRGLFRGLGAAQRAEPLDLDPPILQQVLCVALRSSAARRQPATAGFGDFLGRAL